MKTLAIVLLIAISTAVSQAGADPKAATSAPAQRDQTKPAGDDKVPTSPTDESANKAADAPPPVELKHTSSFKMEGDNRNPFWPIGWKPPERATTATTEHASGDIPPSAFMVSSIMLGTGGHFAIVNGKVMQEGQQFGLQVGTQTYQLTVKAIEDGRVILSRRNQEIIVPLHRK